MIEAAERMEISELEKRAEFQILTPKQQNFVRLYIESGMSTGTYDALAAVQSAYEIAAKNAVNLSYELLGNRKIKAVLNLHFGRTEFDSILIDLGRALSKTLKRDAKTGILSVATSKALEFYERHVAAKTPGTAPIEPESPFTEKEVIRDGRRLLVRVRDLGEVANKE
jgi:hypothetical protein